MFKVKIYVAYDIWKANFLKIISGNDDTLCLKSKSTLAIIFGKANSRKIVPWVYSDLVDIIYL